MPRFSERIRSLLVGRLWGEVLPERPLPVLPANDGRTVALRILREYLAELTFFRAGGVGGLPVAFSVPTKNIHIEWADNDVDLVFPSMSVLAGEGKYESLGLGAMVEEDTRDVYGLGTVLQPQSEYVETFQLELWASQKSERRALLVGLESALAPTETLYGLRFRMPDYFNRTVLFTLLGRTLNDSEEVVRNRRRARVSIEMRYTVVGRVNYVAFEPQTVVEVREQESSTRPKSETDFETFAVTTE